MANGVSMMSVEQRQLIVEMMVRVDKMFDEMRASLGSVKFQNEGVVGGLTSKDFNSDVVDDKKGEEKENDGLMLGIKQNESGSVIGWIPSYDDQVIDSMSKLDYQKLDELENCNQISFCKRDLRDQDQFKAVMLSPSIHSLDAFEHNPIEVYKREKADLKNSFNLMAVTIVSINARQIFDHRGNPTVKVDVKILDGKKVRVVDSGVASTRIYKILEWRDEGFDYLELGSPKLEPKVSKNIVLINHGDTCPFHPFQHCKQENAAWPFVLKAVGACENREKAYSMLFLSKNKLITIRDPYGFRLLVMERMKHGVEVSVRSKILVVVTCLALGTKQMVVPNAIFQPLSFVETLGCTTVNCMDNEGTLTADVMSISKIFVVSYEQNSAVVAESGVRRTTYAPKSFISDSIEKFELPGFDSNALGLTCLKKVESGSKRVKELCLGGKNIVVNSNEKAQYLKKAIEDQISKRGVSGIGIAVTFVEITWDNYKAALVVESFGFLTTFSKTPTHIIEGLMTTAHATTTAQKNVDDFSLHCQQYSEIGAHITNCHAVLKTDSNEPIELAIQENAKRLATYALVVLATGLIHENIKKLFLLDYTLVLLDIETLGGLMVAAAKFDVDNGANQDIVCLQQDLGIYLCNFFNTRQVLKVLKMEGNNFDKARQSVPCVLLYDELDSIATADDATSFASRVHVLQSSLICIICGNVGDMNCVPKVQEIVSANCGKSTCKGIKAIIQGGIPRSDVMKLLLLKVILLSIVDNQPRQKSGAIIKIDSLIIEGNDYFYRLGKGDDDVNMIINARVYIIDNIFAGNFLGKDSDIITGYKMALNHSASSKGMVDDCSSQGASNWDHVRKEICYVCCKVNINSLLYKREL